MLRSYKDIAEIEVGDVIMSFNDAFGTSIVEKIDHDGYAHLVRPFARADHGGAAWLHAERYMISLENIFKLHKVYTTGRDGEKDNRTFAEHIL
jgi:hypothetical protein